MALSKVADQLFASIRETYIAKNYPNHKAWWFKIEAEEEAATAELRAHGYVEMRTMGRPSEAKWGLTNRGLQRVLQPETGGGTGISVHHHGDVIMSGDKFSTNISGSTIGAIAVGKNATADGTVNIDHSRLTQVAHVAQVKAAQKALVEDEESLDDLVREALTQFLTMARKIQVEQMSLAEAQAQMKATLDEVWAAQVAKGMKPQLLPKGLEVVGALAKNQVMNEVVQKLISG